MLSFLLNFWVILGFTITLAIFLLENEREGYATSLLSLAIGIAIYYYHSEIATFLSENLLNVIIFSVLYVVLGVGWSFLKWTSYIKVVIRRYQAIKAKFLLKREEITLKNVSDFMSDVKSAFGGYYYVKDTLELTMDNIKQNVIPLTKDRKSLIVSWIGYWPLSLIGTLLNDPFRRFFGFIFESVSSFYDKITNSQTENVF